MRVHDSQTYRKINVTRERISRTLELREMLLSFQTSLNIISDAVVHATLESISDLEPASVTTEPRYLKLMTVSNFSPFTLISVDTTGVVCHQIGLCTDLHAVGCGSFVETLNQFLSAFPFLPLSRRCHQQSEN